MNARFPTLIGLVLALAVSIPATGYEEVAVALNEPGQGNRFVFEWAADSTPGGGAHSAYVAERFVVEYLDQQVELPDVSAAQALLREHGILLSDEEVPWTAEHAYLLLATLDDIERGADDPRPDPGAIRSKWLLAAGPPADDIELRNDGAGTLVRIGEEAFARAAPRYAVVDGHFGRLHSRRLHHALIRYVTDQGKRRDVVDRLLNERYGVSLSVSDYEKLTRATTAETASSFQEFHPLERIAILEQLEELPPVLQRADELIYLVRRRDGLTHPLHPRAPAVSWPTLEDGYIEFMERAFTGSFMEHTQRLILHERAHFLWTRVLSDGLKSRWIELSDWSPDPDAPTGWSCGKTTEFVSGHAHGRNPVEDLAESFAYFVINPDKLRSRSLPKYELIRDAVTESNIYLSHIREDLTFQVSNLAPNYVYPGGIQRVSVVVDGDRQEDKRVTIELEVHSTGMLGAARTASMRLFSEIDTYVDLRLRPVDETGATVRLGSLLRGEIALSKYAKSGHWRPGQITITDGAGNQRFQGRGDFGWKMVLDNPLEDAVPPRYLSNTAWLSLETDEATFDRPVQVVTATWEVSEDRSMARGSRACNATLVNRDAAAHSMTRWGKFDAVTRKCATRFVLTEHAAAGEYLLSTVRMTDEGGNHQTVRFLDDGGESPQRIAVRTADPDAHSPSLDLDAIQVSARGVRPESPDGETVVSIVYFARDDRSGLGRVSFNLRDPQGIDHHRYHYHDNFYGPIYRGDPEQWTRYEVEVLLPEGSVPGIWGLSTMQLRDQVGNTRNVDFTETLRFEVLD